MGTSTPFGGNKNGNPLIPSWLDAPADQANGAPDQTPQGDPEQGQPNDKPDPSDPPPTVYLRPGRTLLNKRLRSGGGDRERDRERVRRSVGSYVRQGAGGSGTAARRMSASSGAAVGRLGDILFDASREGIRETVRRLDLGDLAQRSIPEIYASLVDFVCGEGGDLDESMNRDAYMNAVDELTGIEGIDLEKPSVETINLLMELFIAGTIDNRIKNAIANGIVLLPETVEQVRVAEQDVRDFVLGAVREAMSEVGKLFARERIRATIDRIYQRAMAVLEVYADDAAGEAA